MIFKKILQEVNYLIRQDIILTVYYDNFESENSISHETVYDTYTLTRENIWTLLNVLCTSMYYGPQCIMYVT